ncbi:MAG: N-6 DNA methylase [Bernardetiaceae bacterium]|nr:N-6 DNA methylase [Bernardetiaceae bacterium]
MEIKKQYPSSLEASKRKEEGVFYSTEEVASFMAKVTIDLLLANSSERFRTLQNIRILDACCGDGVFLLACFDYLKKLYNTNYPTFQNAAHYIVLHNLFGVDLDADAVELCRENLYKKSGLFSDNIKIGNSLVDDPEIDPRAFDWKAEFPQVFTSENSGFSVVIGNPPYVSANNMNFAMRQYFNKSETYKLLQGKWDLFIPFFERGFNMLLPEGVLSFIVPYGMLNQSFATPLREYILKNHSLRAITDLHKVKVFTDATVPTCIPVVFKKQNMFQNVEIKHHRKNEKNEDEFFVSHQIAIKKYWQTENFMFRTEKLDDSFDVLQKIKHCGTQLGELFYVSTGAEIHGKEQRIEGKLISGHSKFDILKTEREEGHKPYIEGSAIPKSRITGPYCYPEIEHYLDYDSNFSRMRSPKFKELFDSPKVIVRGNSGLIGLLATYDNEGLYTSHGAILIISKADLPVRHKQYKTKGRKDLKFLLSLLNSRLMQFYYKNTYGGFIVVYPSYVKALPIPLDISAEIIEELSSRVEILLASHKSLAVLNRQFLQVLRSQFGLTKASRKLEHWYELEWADFTNEMKKAKSPISAKKEFEWVSIFEEKRTEAQNYLKKTAYLKGEIDQIVYQIYQLTPAEIAIVEAQA